jgi:hypothetical protein
MAWAVLVGLVGCDGTFDTADGRVEEGNAALLEGKVDEAKGHYAEAAASLPESPGLNFVRGLAASLGGDHASAADLLLKALDTKDKGFEQRVKAALGIAYAREALALERMPAPAPADGAEPEDKPKIPEPAMEKWKLAVTFLEEALVLDPTDVESRRNLEVALLRVDPPCATRDDSFEDNDHEASAKPLEVKIEEPNASQQEPAAEPNKDLLRFRQQLFSCPDDDDWYRVELAEGDRVEMSATAAKEAGRLKIELIRPDGQRSAELATTGEKVRFTVGRGEAGAWRIHQTNVDFDEASYGLEIVVRPACGKSEDHQEDNDTAGEAKTVTPGPLPDLKSCPGDEDWYSLTLAEGESLFLYAQPADAPSEEEDKKDDKDAPVVPALEVDIYDASGAVRATGAPAGKARVSTLLTPGPGRYLVRTRGAASGFGPGKNEPFEGRYSLQFEVVPPCPEGDDRFEDNDRVEAATDFAEASKPEATQQPANPMAQAQQGPPVVFARVCPGDADWWSFTSTGEKPEIISMTFDHGQGDLDMTLWDEVGTTEIANSKTSSPTQNAEALPLPMAEKTDNVAGHTAQPAPPPGGQAAPSGAGGEPPAPKVYRLEIRGATAEVQNFYLLRLDQPSGGGGDSDGDDKDEQKDDEQDEKDQSEKKDDEKKDKENENKATQNPLQDALDKLDKNPENLQAREAEKKSPLANQKPLKDW